jgi:hypothetical protein
MMIVQESYKKRTYVLLLSTLAIGLLLSFILLACPNTGTDTPAESNSSGLLAQQNNSTPSNDKLPTYMSIDKLVDADKQSKLLNYNGKELNPLAGQSSVHYQSIYKKLADMEYLSDSSRTGTLSTDITTSFPDLTHYRATSLSYKKHYGVKISNITPSQNPVAVVVLVDLNRDGDFADEGEIPLQCELRNNKLYIKGEGAGVSNYTLDFQVPDNAQNGNTLMRVFWSDSTLSELMDILSANKKQSGKDVYATEVPVNIYSVPAQP